MTKETIEGGINLVKEVFDEQQSIMEEIINEGVEEYLKKIVDLPEAFDLQKHQPEGCDCCVCCMDGRTPFGVHAAGSGILLSEKEFEKYLDESGVTEISSHTGCGAGKLAAEAYMRTHPDEVITDTDKFAREWAERMAKKHNLKHVHLEVDKPFHYERVCYYDGTGKFNYKGIEGLPAGFVVGRKFMEKDASLAECQVAKNIIFGHHGFGDLLTEENPFVFVVVAQNPKQLEELKEELKDLVESFGSKVRLDGFIMPKSEEAK